MTTIDLGKIKINWRGTYNNGTAYAIDDAVEYADGGVTSSFICTAASTGNAPSSSGTVHGSWDYLAKGAAGSPLTQRGDILRRGASADERLAKGTSGQVLTMGSDDPAWAAAASGTVKKYYFYQDNSAYTTTSTTWADSNFATAAYVPTASSGTSLLLFFDFKVYCGAGTATYEAKPRHRFPLRVQRKIDSGSWGDILAFNSDAAGGGAILGIDFSNSDTDMIGLHGYSSMVVKDNPNTTGSVYYKVQMRAGLSGMSTTLSGGGKSILTLLEVED